MRCLLDHNVPLLLSRQLTGHAAVHASSLGWNELSDGGLLAAAIAAGFDALVTADQGIRHQQNLTRMPIALVVLDTNHWPTIAPHVAVVIHALDTLQAGDVIVVPFPRLPLRRRRYSDVD